MLDVAQLVETRVMNCFQNVPSSRLVRLLWFAWFISSLSNLLKTLVLRREQIEFEIGEQNYCHVFHKQRKCSMIAKDSWESNHRTSKLLLPSSICLTLDHYSALSVICRITFSNFRRLGCKLRFLFPCYKRLHH